MNERHRVLQLVAKPEKRRPTGGSAARPHTARQGLVEQPTVGQNIEGRIRGLHLHRAQGVIPILQTASRALRAMAAPR